LTDWATKVVSYTKDQIKNLRENAIKRGEEAIAAICDAELESRKPLRPKETKRSSSHLGEVVLGFHFICPKEQGIERAANGQFWSCTWVVARAHAEMASKIGSYVALHTRKSEPSYAQGIVKDFRISPRQREYAEGRKVKNEIGVDFLIEPTSDPKIWKGDATGEKGYFWGPLPETTK
jgi:hypothetical protein